MIPWTWGRGEGSSGKNDAQGQMSPEAKGRVSIK